MTENYDQIKHLQLRLEALQKKQEDFSKEIGILWSEIEKLKAQEFGSKGLVEESKCDVVDSDFNAELTQDQSYQDTPHVTLSNDSTQGNQTSEKIAENGSTGGSEEVPIVQEQETSPFSLPPKRKSNLEKFIGENLINKIGIAITVIGVAIGAKYSIEHDLISPLTRIILCYLSGIGLLGFGMKLKSKYENYSAVLVSGAMAILYFITFAAYDFYQLIPQAMAFLLMLVFTGFTVFAAIQYNRQVIAHIGLVGAYAVPFLLSNGSGNVSVLFSYMAIINIGILLIAFKRYWKPLYFSSFGLSWLIFGSWFVVSYEVQKHFSFALLFLSIFFITFYLMFLAYRLLRNENIEKVDVCLLLINSFIFFALGYAVLCKHELGGQLLGLFTLLNAVIHFAVGATLYRKKLADKTLISLIICLVLVFLTIAIPVQLDGNWVTLMWAGEAALLFWLGKKQKQSTIETLSFPLMVLAFVSLVQDWFGVYSSALYTLDPELSFTPLLNINFLESMLFVAAFGFINWVHQKTKDHSHDLPALQVSKIMSIFLPALLLVSLYFSFRLEIGHYWSLCYEESIQNGSRNYDLKSFGSIWTINYSLLFFSLLALVNLKKFKNSTLGLVNVILIGLSIFSFLTDGLLTLGDLRESYLEKSVVSSYNISIRYLSYVFIALPLVAYHQYFQKMFVQKELKIAFDCLISAIVLWLASSELIHLMDLSGSSDSYKLGLSILWGVYALVLIVLGIKKRKAHLRIGAIALFGFTLLKLFFYDVSHLDTIAKTILFVCLGVLLLIISFMYNKYKHIISDDESH